LLRNDDTKKFFIHEAKEYNKLFDFEMLAYVMMYNHYHLIIKSSAVPRINGAWLLTFNICIFLNVCGHNVIEVRGVPRGKRDNGMDGVYHVYQRGNNREYLLRNDDTKKFFIHQAKEYNKKFDFEMLACVMMDNHYHLIIKTNKDPLYEIMFNINNVFVKYLNKQLSRTGHAFEARYKCKRIETDAYLLWLLRYVHRNPLRAKMVNELDDYYWSSHNSYKTGSLSFVNSHFILKILSNNRNNAIKKYLKLMKAVGNDKDEIYDYEVIKDSMFNEWNIADSKTDIEINHNEVVRESLDSLADKDFKEIVMKQLIINGNKRRDLTPLKLSFIEDALKLKYTLKEIAQYLNSTEASISLLQSRHRAQMVPVT
jgi:putative transposase